LHIVLVDPHLSGEPGRSSPTSWKSTPLSCRNCRTIRTVARCGTG
jgi:hypothetical protein